MLAMRCSLLVDEIEDDIEMGSAGCYSRLGLVAVDVDGIAIGRNDREATTVVVVNSSITEGWVRTEEEEGARLLLMTTSSVGAKVKDGSKRR
ncbi:hypothetical protein BHM03_00042077 [Ensete ventricosum]|nr:hypothetical protein BHM03_00042077 [Ensete ventricosum]